ncbi:phosphomevalonate kinase [Lentilactobacillus sp. SPB1-3]|uniref:Phosphomevalonate kinase n=1 Tax=Lentilactobacillus terminaliae TaxID=3003483 RepID=A0ACD5DC11_9LACO|nr:phosphomevalonate kinase [Lentilactobacillus sp. SPB1-3]MCZ0977228.1 phosphomevalonate kinase [Lentilactobacillus sp. SPB1-3]
MITAKAPGKLYIAGEYAIVEPGYPSIIVALDQFVTIQIERSEGFGKIVSHQYQDGAIRWRRNGSQMVIDNRDNTFSYILSAISLTEEYAQLLGKNMAVYDLFVNSQLDSPSGRKYGLGSSAAVTVATIKALCQFYGLPLTKTKLFKLAAIAHLEVQGNGSLGDIAASVYGGWIEYRSFNRDWLLAMRNTSDLDAIINQPWPELKITELTPPDDLKLIIGWTGTPASTSHLVDKVTIKKSRNYKAYSEFLNASKQCIEDLLIGFNNGDVQQIAAGIKENRRILNSLAEFTEVQIETPMLKQMCDIAVENGAAAKSSGAGGGDCGIVIIDRNLPTDNLINEWRNIDITPLPLTVHEITDLSF